MRLASLAFSIVQSHGKDFMVPNIAIALGGRLRYHYVTEPIQYHHQSIDTKQAPRACAVAARQNPPPPSLAPAIELNA